MLRLLRRPCLQAGLPLAAAATLAASACPDARNPGPKTRPAGAEESGSPSDTGDTEDDGCCSGSDTDTGVDAAGPPHAVVSCPAQVEALDEVTLDGSASYTEHGDSFLTYQWALLTQPAAASGYVAQPHAASTLAYMDRVGAYEFELVVTNTEGLASSPATCEVEVVPYRELHVEVLW